MNASEHPPFSPEWAKESRRSVATSCYWRLIDLSQTLREELKDVDMSRIRFTLTPNSVWDLLEKRVAFSIDGVREEDKARYRPFATHSHRVPLAEMTTAEFLNHKTENNYIVIFPQEDRTIYRERDGMALIQMATLGLKHW